MEIKQKTTCICDNCTAIASAFDGDKCKVCPDGNMMDLSKPRETLTFADAMEVFAKNPEAPTSAEPV